MNKPVLIVSLDFELFWGMQDCALPERYRPNVLGARQAVPALLDLFRRHGIHATWAAVGFLFAEDEKTLRSFFPEALPTYETEALSAYRCFGHIGADEESAPCFYAPSLLRQIASREGQEIGTHTFSHFYCQEKGQTLEQFRSDISAARRIGSHYGCDLQSLVLPRNQWEPEYTKHLRELGITAVRGRENDWIHNHIRFPALLRLLRLADVYLPLTGQGGYIPREEYGVVNLTGSRMFKPIFPPLFFLEGLKLRRIKKQMLHAAENGLTFHLWWHPHNIGLRTEDHLRQLEEIFSYYEELKKQYGMESKTMQEAAEDFRRKH